MFIKKGDVTLIKGEESAPKEDGSYTIEDTFVANYIGVVKSSTEVTGNHTINIGTYNGKLKLEEHIYTFIAHYYVQEKFKFLGDMNLGILNKDSYVQDPVNIITGNLYSDNTDLAILDIGTMITAKRYYNSHDEREGIMGKSWRFHYDSYIEPMDGEKHLKVVYPSGRTDIYIYDNDNNKYSGVTGVYDELTKEDDGSYTLIKQDKTKKIYMEQTSSLTR